jgi:hypothetical protein
MIINYNDASAQCSPIKLSDNFNALPPDIQMKIIGNIKRYCPKTDLCNFAHTCKDINDLVQKVYTQSINAIKSKINVDREKDINTTKTNTIKFVTATFKSPKGTRTFPGILVSCKGIEEYKETDQGTYINMAKTKTIEHDRYLAWSVAKTTSIFIPLFLTGYNDNSEVEQFEAIVKGKYISTLAGDAAKKISVNNRSNVTAIVLHNSKINSEVSLEHLYVKPEFIVPILRIAQSKIRKLRRSEADMQDKTIKKAVDNDEAVRFDAPSSLLEEYLAPEVIYFNTFIKALEKFLNDLK